MRDPNDGSEDTVHVLMMEDKKSGYWSAQCLEYDIAAQAKSLNAIVDEVERILNCHLVYAAKHNTKPFGNLKSAPAPFWKMYWDATTEKSRTVKVDPPREQGARKTPIEGRVLQHC